MCTLVILRRPRHRWPVLIGANRDEMIDRPSKPPGRHWSDRPEVVALAERPEALGQPVWFAVALGNNGDVPADRSSFVGFRLARTYN